MLYAKAYAAALVAFLVLDAIWLGVVARGFYAGQLGGLMRDNVNFLVAGGFYVAYVAGVVYFAVMPALEQGAWSRALLNGALLGLLAYGTYDMTNIATLKGWPVVMSMVDMAWGMVVTASAAVTGYWLARI